MTGLQAEQERHFTFLEREFAANGFLEDDPFELKKSLLNEIVETIFEPPFEGQKPIHGAMVCSHEFNSYYKQYLPYEDSVDENSEVAQTLCDGITVFRLKGSEQNNGVVILSEPIIDELDLFRLRDDVLYKLPGETHDDKPSKEFYVVKKGAAGEITILCREGIAIHRDAKIKFFRYQYHFKSLLNEYIESKWGESPWEKQTLDSILRMAIHSLSPIPGVGGTFVLLHPNDKINCCDKSHVITETELLNQKNSVTFPWGLEVKLRTHQTMLVNLMKNTDGAVIISDKGYVNSARCWLVMPRATLSLTQSDGGTRHLTAQSFSTLILGLVFVVSSDGPVTLYANGEIVFRTIEKR